MKAFVRKLPPTAFERMQLLARANGFVLKTESEVFRICYLADVFRKVYHIGDMVPTTRQRRQLDPCPTISAAPRTIIRRGKEVAEIQVQSGPKQKAPPRQRGRLPISSMVPGVSHIVP